MQTLFLWKREEIQWVRWGFERVKWVLSHPWVSGLVRSIFFQRLHPSSQRVHEGSLKCGSLMPPRAIIEVDWPEHIVDECLRIGGVLTVLN